MSETQTLQHLNVALSGSLAAGTSLLPILIAGTASSGRMPPSEWTPRTLSVVQQFGLPRRQAMQRPQLM